ncbi:MAG: hypothetical protein KDC71_20120 [Acidobacteria bacterium]|nr:hypothetical protein [Acidobacteriota bacterium]
MKFPRKTVYRPTPLANGAITALIWPFVAALCWGIWNLGVPSWPRLDTAVRLLAFFMLFGSLHIASAIATAILKRWAGRIVKRGDQLPPNWFIAKEIIDRPKKRFGFF